MDAANLSFKRIAISAAFAVLLPAAAFAQPAFQLSPSSVALSGQSPVNVGVSSTTTTNLGYSAIVTYPNSGDLNWLCVNPNGGASTSPIGNGGSVTGLATPDFLTFTVCGSPAINVTTHQATVTLNETDGFGTASASIPVTYTLGSGGGGGTGSVVASPSSITETITYGTSFGPIQVILSTASIQPIAFTVGSTPSWITWYQGSGNNGFVSAGQSAVLQISLNGSGQSESTLSTTFVVNAATGAVNIPITLNNGVAGSGGTTGTGSLSVSPASLSWNYSASSGSAFPSQTTLSMSSTNGYITYNATAASSNGWLLINNSFTASGTVGVTPLTIAPSTNLGALAAGTYTGTVTIDGSDGSTAIVTVTATVNGTGSTAITINPSPISLTAAVNGATTQATVSVTSTVSGTLSASVSGGSGLSVSGSGQFVTVGSPVYLTVYGSPAGLSNATYQGTLNISVAGNSTSAQINFVVGTGNNNSGGTNASASPAQLTFYYEPNTNMQSSQTQQVWLSGSGNFTLSSSTANTSNNWLGVSPTAGTLPSLIYVTVSPFGLASSTYNGQITIDNTSTGQTTTVGVSLVINGATTIYASPGDWVFNYISGISSTVQSQAITIAASDGTSVPVAATVSNASSTPWLTVSGSGNTPLGITAIVNSSNLANGVYSGSILITGGNNSLAVPIVLTVTGSSVSTGTGPLTLGASSLTLQALVNGASVAQAVSVNAASSTTFTVSGSGTYNGINWLSVNPFGTTSTPATVTVTASPAGLPAGTYSGTVSLSANGSTQTIPVSFVVGTSDSGGTSVVVTANGGTSTSPSLTFTASSVGATLTPQYLSVTSTSGESSVLFSASASASWIQLGTVSGTLYSTPLNSLTVTANTAGLAAGTYNGTVTISPSGGTAVSVPVTLTIAGAPGISVTSSSLSFAYAAGGQTPATQTIPVTVSNGPSASYTATASSTPSAWLQVSPGSGTAPGNLTVSINPTGLGAGSYSGAITVAGASGATGSATVNVTLTVTVPLPTVTAVVNAASFINEPLSPGEIITIGGTNIGPSTAQSFTVSNNLVPTSLGGVQVLINGYAAPILYVSSTQINAIVPYEIAGILNPTVLVETNVSANSPTGTSSNGYTVNAGATAPGIFTANGSGTGPGAILNSDSSVNTASNPAARGSVVQVFMTGEGQTQPKGIDGWVTTAPYPTPLLPLAITVGGSPANYEFAGEAPGLVSGVLQLNVIIPSTLTVTGAVPLNVSIGSGVTQGGVTVNIK